MPYWSVFLFLSAAAGSAVSGPPSTEAVAHDGNDLVGLSIGVEVEIAAEVGPVIQRFDHNHLAPSVLESATNGMQKWKRMIYASTLVLNCTCGPF